MNINEFCDWLNKELDQICIMPGKCVAFEAPIICMSFDTGKVDIQYLLAGYTNIRAVKIAKVHKVTNADENLVDQSDNWIVDMCGYVEAVAWELANEPCKHSSYLDDLKIYDNKERHKKAIEYLRSLEYEDGIILALSEHHFIEEGYDKGRFHPMNFEDDLGRLEKIDTVIEYGPFEEQWKNCCE